MEKGVVASKYRWAIPFSQCPNTVQIGGHTLWQFNATVSQIRTQFQIASNITQLMRDITPGSGAYFVRFWLYSSTLLIQE
jgi:hypothetical protein